MNDAPRAKPNIILNRNELGRMASALLEEVRKQKEQLSVVVVDLAEQAEKLFQAAISVGRSHSHSNFGYHGSLYYKDFEIPTLSTMFNVEWGGVDGIAPGWAQRRPDEVKRRIEELAGLSFGATKEAVKIPLGAAKELLQDILIRLAPLHQLPDGNREKQLLDALESFDWEESAHNKYAAQAMKAFPTATRDSGAFHQGLMFPESRPSCWADARCKLQVGAEGEEAAVAILDDELA
jgi:hypothetical protein